MSIQNSSTLTEAYSRTGGTQEVAKVGYSPPPRIEYLDSIRGLAALAVLLQHTQGVFNWPEGYLAFCRLPFVATIFDGKAAVAMFFVLSGFVLSHPYLGPSEAKDAPRKLFIPTFYLRRFTRIWIPWFFAFALSILVQSFLFAPHPKTSPATSVSFEAFWHAPLTFSNCLKQCAFALQNARLQLLPQDWSLDVELKGSALIPVYLFLARRFVPGLGALAIVILVSVSSGHNYVSFALGVMIARYYLPLSRTVCSLSLGWKCALLALGVLLYQSRWYVIAFQIRVGEKFIWCLTSLGCTLILIAALNSRRIQKILNLPGIATLGKVSFSVYLLQFIVIMALLPPFVQMLNLVGIHSVALIFPMTFAVSVLVTVMLSLVTYHTVESSSIELGRTLTRAIQSRLSKRASPR